ncbi:hypothetical protein STEG23_002880 [Scotinomys teguina]
MSCHCSNSTQKARLEICALRDTVAIYLTPESRSSFKQALEALPQLASGADKKMPFPSGGVYENLLLAVNVLWFGPLAFLQSDEKYNSEKIQCMLKHPLKCIPSHPQWQWEQLYHITQEKTLCSSLSSSKIKDIRKENKFIGVHNISTTRERADKSEKNIGPPTQLLPGPHKVLAPTVPFCFPDAGKPSYSGWNMIISSLRAAVTRGINAMLLRHGRTFGDQEIITSQSQPTLVLSDF